jgi:hypothetical protein
MKQGLVNHPHDSSTLVEHLLHHPKIEGSSSASAAAPGEKKVLKQSKINSVSIVGTDSMC